MHGEEGLTRYWFFMNFFIGNMLLLVLSDNLIQMLFGWEGVGLCSYALIGFWYRDSKKDWLKCWVGEGDEAYPPSHCGMKAFMVTRLGDLLLLAGVFILVSYTGTLNFLELQNGSIYTIPTPMLLMAILLILGGPIGKSAQLPLMEWLPDAMAGPTSVSALIHAATMVKAGVYLIARLFPMIYRVAWNGSYNELSLFFYTVAWIGALTAFVAATQAIPATELKKVLAYSTVSQLGYMMLGLGVAGLSNDPVIGYAGSIFHLMSHATFKAALFLSAGAVIHAVHSRFLYHMGGLRKYMPKTFWCMLFASFSLMGVPIIFSGFWSKDMILEASLTAGEFLLFAIGIITAGLTCFYTIRMIGLTFFGKEGEKVKTGHMHEAPLVMLIPYGILVAGTILLGVLGYFIGGWLEEIFHPYLLGHRLHTEIIHQVDIGLTHEAAVMITIASSLSMLVVGAYTAYKFYIERAVDLEVMLEKKPLLKRLRYFFFRRWYINMVYYKVFTYPTIGFARWFFLNIERKVIDGFNNLAASSLVKFSRWFFLTIDKAIIDGFNYVIAYMALNLSESFRKTHTGILNYNVLGMVLGMILVFLMLLGVLLGW